jgi:hypothetical protein
MCLFSVLVVSGLMTVLIANNRSPLSAPEQFMVRPLEVVATLPPPKPPASVSQAMAKPALQLDLSLQGEGPSLTLSPIKLAMQKPVLNAPNIEPKVPDFDTGNLAIALKGFAISELDGQPRLLTPLRIEFTPEMKRDKVKKILVKLHVVIDEAGKVHLKAIKDNPYPKLSSALKQLISKVRFSPPQRHGKPVQAEFIWPLMLKN